MALELHLRYTVLTRTGCHLAGYQSLHCLLGPSGSLVLLDLHTDADKGSTSPDMYVSQFKEILGCYADHSALYTDGFKVGDTVAYSAAGSFSVPKHSMGHPYTQMN